MHFSQANLYEKEVVKVLLVELPHLNVKLKKPVVTYNYKLILPVPSVGRTVN